MNDRELRDLKAELYELREKFVPVSESRLDTLWASVRETVDEFSKKLVGLELNQRGFNDTIARLLHQHRQIETVMAGQAVHLHELQEQVNTLAVALNELREANVGVHD